ncbi:MAG: hypothetical protein IT578_05500 [Verrucomicrobiae bacterium]|nr:hypothetical protein [Verrucomicrobiae bacterium]
MKIRFDRDLIEAAYLSAGPREDLDREELYDLRDERERNEAFGAHHARWFRKAGFEARLLGAFAEWPRVGENCEEAVLRRVRNPADEFAELFRNREGLSRVGVGLRASRLTDGSYLPFLRHELAHLDDMFDPGFGYPGEVPRDPSPAAQLRRERYRILWDLRGDSRLQRRFPDAPDFSKALARHRSEFERVFSFMDLAEREALFDEITSETSAPHARLWEVACDPRHLRGRESVEAPGAECPLCRFSTFQWASNEARETAAPAIRNEFPDWRPEHGCCERCAEVYAAVRSSAIPPTVLLPSRLSQSSRVLLQ